MSDIDDRIAAALRAAADQVGEADLRPASPPTAASLTVRPRRPLRWIAPVFAAAAVVGIAVAVTAVANHEPAPTPVHINPGANSHTTPTALASTPPPSVLPSRAGICYFTGVGCAEGPADPTVWPFASLKAADEWRTKSASEGTQPWHLDPAQTALFFTQNYLGFTDITEVTSTTIDHVTDTAYIGVGYQVNGQTKTAAVIQLRPMETYLHEADAPWEVIGTERATLSISSPAWSVADTAVGSHFTVTGRITGVDESLTLTVRSLATTATFTRQGVPAGGNNGVWSIPATAPAQGIVTIVVSTGGHVQQHERFAIQGVHVSSGS
jgi:hypothetical protein